METRSATADEHFLHRKPFLADTSRHRKMRTSSPLTPSAFGSHHASGLRLTEDSHRYRCIRGILAAPPVAFVRVAPLGPHPRHRWPQSHASSKVDVHSGCAGRDGLLTGKVAPEHRRLSRYGTMAVEEICALPV